TPDPQAEVASEGQLRSARFKRFRAEHQWLQWLALALVVIGAVLLLMSPIVGGALIGFVLIVAIIIYMYQASKAEAEFFQAYADARGLTCDEDPGRPGGEVPLLDKGDKRKYERVLSGRIGGSSASICEYTYTEITTDSEGNRSETDYHFTLVHMKLPPAVANRFAGVYLRKKGLINLGGKLQDKMQHDRAVTTESLEFHKRYNLRVVDGQDDIALFELFNTTFLHGVSVSDKVTGDDIQWEQVRDDLIVYVKDHKETVAELDQLATLAAWIERRYHEEYQ
ncbi:MAG: hypothetical protein H7123_08425, partial [Thermoleophilia bacterium]|nr:hypothetical protein [Thermoleophilia bacterium]